MRRHALPSIEGLVAVNGVVGITADSRAVRPGYVFAALPGAKADGRTFIGEAVARGAVAVLAPEGTLWPPGVPPVPLVLDKEPRAVLAQFAVKLAGALPERLVAVTGTNGKTSTVDFLRQIFSAAGRHAASIGTLGLIAPGQPVRETLTTPDAVTLAETLAGLAKQGVTDVALEASSHGLSQYRLDGLIFAAAGFTNLTRDHLDYHGDMDAYRAAKLRLFEFLLPAGAPVAAMEDLEPATMAALTEISRRRSLRLHRVAIERVAPQPDGQMVVSRGAEFFLPLPGRFQADNAMLAVTLAGALGVRQAAQYLASLVGVRGRLERAVTLPNGAAAYVDYAHTPDAIARAVAALRPHAAGRLVIVFGAGGDRDAGKRPLMGAAAAAGADLCIVTDDNPRTENPAAIRAAVLAACPGALEIGDRREALAAGLAALRPGDVLIAAGKGHEQGQIVGHDIIPFDDASVLRALAGA
jgi:UDP-N-acetylmuramoyl-L-alanyl-D-glutamate--2,6-diaminopimelate ligase